MPAPNSTTTSIPTASSVSFATVGTRDFRDRSGEQYVTLGTCFSTEDLWLTAAEASELAQALQEHAAAITD